MQSDSQRSITSCRPPRYFQQTPFGFDLIRVCFGCIPTEDLIDAESPAITSDTRHRQRAWGFRAVLMFAKAKGNWDLGEGLCAKGERTQGIEGDRVQVKYVRRPRVHIFISITAKKKLVWAPIWLFLLLPLDVKIECLQGADHQWCFTWGSDRHQS